MATINKLLINNTFSFKKFVKYKNVNDGQLFQMYAVFYKTGLNQIKASQAD